MTSDTWRNQLRTWADRHARDFIKKPGILGVVIGGSLARGQEWCHSDLELGILVEDKDAALPYFNVDHGRGVEVIFHSLYREVFALSDTNRVIKNTWPLVKTRVLEITRLWGDDTRNFFVHAVDSEFKWRQNAGILTVYRLYLPLIGSIQGSLDDAEWAEKNRDLLAFLGLADLDNDLVSQLMDRIEESCKPLKVLPDCSEFPAGYDF
jgi:predicted nucleotidyltransferase